MPDSVLTEDRPAEAPAAEPAAPEQPEAPKKRRFRLTLFWIFLICLIVVMALLLAVYQSRAASDFFLNKIHPPVADFIGRITGSIPLPICEIADGLAVMAGGALLFCLFLLIFLRKYKGYRCFVGICCKAALTIAVVYFGGSLLFDARMLNSSVIGKPDYQAKEHTLEDVTALWNRWQTEVNTLLRTVDRDENHHLIHRTEDEIRADLVKTRQKLSAEFGRFSIDPPQEKTSLVSPVLDSFGIAAYTISPTMEIVFSDRYEYKPTFASVYAHEFSHYTGFWREDEANYFGFRLCDLSDDPNIRYAGYLDLYHDLGNALNSAYFGDEPVDVEDEGYTRYCEEHLVQFEDQEQCYLFICDLRGNYKLYHELRDEEVVVDEKPDFISLPDSAAEYVSDKGDEHFSDLQEKLGSHYYDGVIQLLLDDYM